MKPGFIETGNTRKFEEICAELTSPSSLIGPSLAMVTGNTGRGKSEAAKHYAVNSDSIYLPPMNIRTPGMVLREICFDLSGLKPLRSDECLSLIEEEIGKKRRLIIVDEAEELGIRVLEMLRNINERFSCPIMLIGEEKLKGKIGSRRRLSSRVRRRMEFGPINQLDIAYFFKTALGVKVGPDITGMICKHVNGDWRPVLTAAIGIERAMTASNVNEISVEMVQNVLKNS